ncbi:DISARM system phospholipase D-like protein DrmC, partial [Gammaproteobacteria bacterium]|nr:DISARM system phospholipase D-like protein DrmC [Gammaproteobacteria bacterium]
QVLKQLIDSAQEDVFIVSYVSVNIASIDEAIKQAIARGVTVRMLLESKSERGNDSFARNIRHYKDGFPGLQLYIWPEERREAVGYGIASVHAKCAVADGKQLFVTSANLTGAAMDKNIEIGVFLKGGAIALQAREQLLSLVTVNEIRLA